MKIKNHVLKYKTKKFVDFIDITEDIESLIKKEKIKNGHVLVFSKHTTAAIRINEKEQGIYKDFKQLIKKIIPAEQYYHHNDLTKRTENLVCDVGASDCLNGHSHCLHLLMGATSEYIPIINGKLAFGLYQRIFLIELDCPRSREVIVQIASEN